MIHDVIHFLVKLRVVVPTLNPSWSLLLIVLQVLLRLGYFPLFSFTRGLPSFCNEVLNGSVFFLYDGMDDRVEPSFLPVSLLIDREGQF
jgi:hypothetical protein